MRAFLRKDDHYNAKALAKYTRQAEASRYRSNPYTWQFYSAYFDTCGILYLFSKLWLFEIIPTRLFL